MKLLSLACRHCGAPLEVPTRVRQVECLFCGSRLHVQWPNAGPDRNAPEEPVRPTAELTSTPEQLRIEEEIHRLDDAWKEFRSGFMIRSHDDRLKVPDKSHTLLACAIGVMLGVVACTVGVGVGWAPNSLDAGNVLVGRLLALVGVLMIVVVAVWSRISYRKAVNFEVHQQAYQYERQRLLAELEKSPYAVADRDRA